MAIRYKGNLNGSERLDTKFGHPPERDVSFNVEILVTVLSAKLSGESSIESVLQIEGDIVGTATIHFTGERSGLNYVKQTYNHLLSSDLAGGTRE